jgi:epidermal growth factor receptor substrate 15
VPVAPVATSNLSPSLDDIFGSPQSKVLPTAVPSTRAPFDDFEDDFEGLEDAKEGSADDDFATISRSGLDDFNPVFDSSPPASQTKSESTAFGVESSFDFGAASTTSAAGTTPAADSTGLAQKTAPTPPDAHDWDAIFATLEPPSDTAGGSSSQSPKEARPVAPGRALTEGGEHDDPILKNLTSMGYSRADALLALEKYDYNLERVSDTVLIAKSS